MGRAHVRSSQPERWSDNVASGVETGNNKGCVPPAKETQDVFKKHNLGLDCLDELQSLTPEISFVCNSLLLTRAGHRLARGATNDEIHHASKSFSWDVGKVAANRRWLQGLLFHPRQEDGLAVGLPLAVANHARGESEVLEGCFDAEVESADACEKREDIDGGIIHMSPIPSSKVFKGNRPDAWRIPVPHEAHKLSMSPRWCSVVWSETVHGDEAHGIGNSFQIVSDSSEAVRGVCRGILVTDKNVEPNVALGDSRVT
jgi:hypothetical protein